MSNLTLSPGNVARLLRHYIDPQFYARILELAWPIALQQLLVSALNLAASLVVGQLGDVPVAAVGLCNQIYFLFMLLMFGISSGASIFGAQFWGQRDVPNIRRVLGLGLIISVTGGALFAFVTLAFPEWALGVYSRDPAVITLGSAYLRISGWCCLFWAVSYIYSAMLRSVGEVRLPMVVSIVSLSLNLAISYALVLGQFGLPKLGAVGAAYGLGLSRGLECLLLVGAIYWKKMAVAATLREMFSFDRRLVKAVLIRMLPVTLNEIMWSLGMTTYSIIYARLGTDALAAINMIQVIDNLAFVPFIALGSACSIMVGHAIGAGDDGRAFRQGGLVLGLTIAGALVQGGVVWLAAGWVLSFYKVSAVTAGYAHDILFFLGLGLWLKASNFMLMVGALRAGGDTRFSLYVDGGSIWGVGVTLAALGAFVLHWPVPLVYALTLGDELVKVCILLYRFLSRKWIHRLTHVTDLP